jgi:hypothetical protein
LVGPLFGARVFVSQLLTQASSSLFVIGGLVVASGLLRQDRSRSVFLIRDLFLDRDLFLFSELLFVEYLPLDWLILVGCLVLDCRSLLVGQGRLFVRRLFLDDAGLLFVDRPFVDRPFLL